MIAAIVEGMLTEEQLQLLRVSLSNVSTQVLNRVVHDGLSESEALDWAHTVTELTAILEMLPVRTGST